MALTVGIVPNGVLYIGDTKVSVEQVMHPMNFKVKVHGECMDQVYTITDKRATEIMPNVMMSAGHKGTDDMLKVVVNAPRNIKILREKLYNVARGQS